MAMMKPAQAMTLPEFATTLIERTGGVVQGLGEGLYAALLAPELTGEGIERLVTLAFDPEQARENPEAVMVTYGSPLLDRWIELARLRGRACSLWIRGLPVHPRTLPSPRTALAVEGADQEIGQGIPQGFQTTLFSFRVSFHSDEREEERRDIAVEAFYGRIARGFPERLRQASLSEGDEEQKGCPPTTSLDLRRQHAIAREELERGLLAGLQARKQALEERRRREIGKVAGYFEASLSDLTEALEDARDDPERSGPLLQKVAAVQAEKSRQLSQTEANHALSARVSLSSVLEVVQPKVVFPCHIPVPRGLPAKVSLVWDPLLEGWMAPPCPACGRPTTRLIVKRVGGIVCALCEAGGAAAGKSSRRG